MGVMRFTMFGVWRIIFLKRMFSSLYYLNSNVPSDNKNPTLKDNLDNNLYGYENSTNNLMF